MAFALYIVVCLAKTRQLSIRVDGPGHAIDQHLNPNYREYQSHNTGDHAQARRAQIAHETFAINEKCVGYDA